MFTTSDILALTTTEIAALTSSDIASLTVPDIQTFTTTQLAALTPTQILEFTQPQLSAFPADMWASVQDGVVRQCVSAASSPSSDGSSLWYPCVVVKPSITPNQQYYGQQYWNTNVIPVQLIYPVLDYTDVQAAANLALANQQSAQDNYNALIAGGLTITSTSTPSVNAVYKVDAQATADILAEVAFISTFQEFTNGSATSFVWYNATPIVTFTSMPTFVSVAKACAQFVAAAKVALAISSTGAAWSPPSNSVTIA